MQVQRRNKPTRDVGQPSEACESRALKQMIYKLFKCYTTEHNHVIYAMAFHLSNLFCKYYEFYLAIKCETQQTCKQTVEQLSRRQETHWSHDHEIHHNVIIFFLKKKNPRTERAKTW